jgi:hypothetical protein
MVVFVALASMALASMRVCAGMVDDSIDISPLLGTDLDTAVSR